MENYHNNRFEIVIDKTYNKAEIYSWNDKFETHRDRLTIQLDALDNLRDAINKLDNKRE